MSVLELASLLPEAALSSGRLLEVKSAVDFRLFIYFDLVASLFGIIVACLIINDSINLNHIVVIIPGRREMILLTLILLRSLTLALMLIELILLKSPPWSQLGMLILLSQIVVVIGLLILVGLLIELRGLRGVQSAGVGVEVGLALIVTGWVLLPFL